MWSVHISIVKVRANEEHIVGQCYKTFFHFIDAIDKYNLSLFIWQTGDLYYIIFVVVINARVFKLHVIAPPP